MAECKCCGQTRDLRFGACFDCADSESIIFEGVNMFGESVEKVDGLSPAMSKLQYILKKYGVVKK